MHGTLRGLCGCAGCRVGIVFMSVLGFEGELQLGLSRPLFLNGYNTPPLHITLPPCPPGSESGYRILSGSCDPCELVVPLGSLIKAKFGLLVQRNLTSKEKQG